MQIDVWRPAFMKATEKVKRMGVACCVGMAFLKTRKAVPRLFLFERDKTHHVLAGNLADFRIG